MTENVCPEGTIYNCGCSGGADVITSPNTCIERESGIWAEWCSQEDSSNNQTCDCATSDPTCPINDALTSGCSNTRMTTYESCLQGGYQWWTFCTPTIRCSYNNYEVCTITSGCKWNGSQCLVSDSSLGHCKNQ